MKAKGIATIQAVNSSREGGEDQTKIQKTRRNRNHESTPRPPLDSIETELDAIARFN